VAVAVRFALRVQLSCSEGPHSLAAALYALPPVPPWQACVYEGHRFAPPSVVLGLKVGAGQLVAVVHGSLDALSQRGAQQCYLGGSRCISASLPCPVTLLCHMPVRSVQVIVHIPWVLLLAGARR
jgi:hypothetical protein